LILFTTLISGQQSPLYLVLGLGIVLTAKTLTDVLVLLAIILLILAVVLAIAVRSASKGRLKKLVLTDSLEKESGFEGTEDFTSFLGKEGVALTALQALQSLTE